MSKYLVTLEIESDSNPADWDWDSTIVLDDEPTKLIESKRIVEPYAYLLEKVNNLPETIGLSEFKSRQDALRKVVELMKDFSKDEMLESYANSYIFMSIAEAIEKELAR